MAKQLYSTKTRTESMPHDPLALRIISSTCSELPSGPSDIREILYASCGTFGGSRTLVQINNNANFLIWVQEVFEPASWTLEQVQLYLERRCFHQSPEATIALFSSDESIGAESRKATGYKTFMVSVLPLKAEAASSASISYVDRQALEDFRLEDLRQKSKIPRNWIRRNLAFVTAALILVVLGAILTALPYINRKASTTDVWLSWELPKDSEGPQNQLQFTWPHPNFTTWSAKNDYSVDDFYLRLDDQTMIPNQYVDDYELQYQAWYAKHYPWFAEIGASRTYLNESYWRDTRSYPLAIDHEFHVAHCVLTMKRYWKARESRHHVCPRDINHNHISHCFGVLESYAFNGFETTHRMDPQVNGTSLMWIVNACF